MDNSRVLGEGKKGVRELTVQCGERRRRGGGSWGRRLGLRVVHLHVFRHRGGGGGCGGEERNCSSRRGFCGVVADR